MTLIMNTYTLKSPPTLMATAQPAMNTRSWTAWAYVAALCLASLGLLNHYWSAVDDYGVGVSVFATAALSWAGYRWCGLRRLVLGLALTSWFAYWLYQGQPERAQQSFFLKYFFASQSAIMWMFTLSLAATICYWVGLLLPRQTDAPANNYVLSSAHGLVWCAVYFGFTGLLVRWFESYQIGAEVGHIPVSNLYEVSILFCLITMLMLLYYEGISGLKTLGAFVMLVVLADSAFTLWYAVSRQAFSIQPLIPALQSWWMKIHVPANFVGYGAFSAAAMLAVPHLIASAYPKLAPHLPDRHKIENIMYRLIATGFVAFTIATILGALWAAEAWGAYWQWDPKETWALIVWLNYAAWLHIRQLHRVSTKWLSWWAIIGLLITAFAFYGVNMYLSGLHSYGAL